MKKPARKRLGELLIEAGIITPSELPKGLEYAQKATDQDLQAVVDAKSLIENQGLSVPTALRALSLSKQRRCNLEQALHELGWHPRRISGFEVAPGNGGAAPPTFNNVFPDDLNAAPPAPPEVPYDPYNSPNFTYESQLETDPRIPPIGPNPLTQLPADVGQTKAETETETEAAPAGPDMSRYVKAPTYAPDPIPGLAAQWTETADNYFMMLNYENAEAFYGQALTTLKGLGGPPDLNAAAIMLKLARVCFFASKYQHAENLYYKALQVRESYLGKEHMAVAECLDALAELYDEQAQYIQAENYYLNAIGIKERVLSPSNVELTNSLKKLVLVSKRQGSRPEQKLSGELMVGAGLVDEQKVIEGLEVARDRQMPIGKALIWLNYLSDTDLKSVLKVQLLLRQGVLPAHVAVRALRYASQRLISLEQALSEIGLDLDEAIHVEEASQMLNMADQLMQTDFQQAEVDTSELQTHPEPIEQPQVVENIANLAEQLQTAESNQDSPEVAMLSIQLGDLNLDQGKYDEAEWLYKRGYRIVEKEFGRDNLDTAEAMMRLGILYYRLERYGDAEAIYRDVLDVQQKCLGETDLDVANTMEGLATLRYMQGDYEDAGRFYSGSLAIKEQLLGADHSDLLAALQGSANCYFANGQYAEAEGLYLRAIAINERDYGSYDQQVLMLVETLGDLYFNQGEPVKAQKQYERAADIHSNQATPDYMTYSALLEKLGYCLAEQQNFEHSEMIYRQVIQMREQTGTAQNPDMAPILESYAHVVENLGRAEEAANLRDIASRIAEDYSETTTA